MNELDRSTYTFENYDHHDASAVLSQYLADDVRSRSSATRASNVEQTHNYLGVAADLGNGMISEVVNHPGQMLSTFAESAAAGAALRFAPAMIRLPLVAGSLAYGAYELGTSAPKWYSDASTVVNGSIKSPDELAQAHANLEHLGGGIVEFGVGLGGVGVGMHLPELRSAIASPMNAYRNGAISADQLYPSFKETFKRQASSVDWKADPAWVKPASDALREQVANFKNIPVPNASTMFQTASGIFESGIGKARALWEGKGAASEAPSMNPERGAPPPESVAPDASTTPGAETVSPAAHEAGKAETNGAVHQGVDSHGNPFTVESEPDHFAASPEASESSVEGAPAGAAVHEGVDGKGSPFTVEEEPDHFAAAPELVEPSAIEAPAGGAVVHEGVDGKGIPFTVEEQPDHFAAPSEVVEGGGSVASVSSPEAIIHKGVDSQGHAFSVEEQPDFVASRAPESEADAPAPGEWGVFHAGTDSEGRPFTVHEEPDHFAPGAGTAAEQVLSDSLTEEIAARYEEIKALPDEQLSALLTETLKGDPDKASVETQLLWHESLVRMHGASGV